MLNAAGAVDKVVDLALQHRLKVGLHLATGHLHNDAHVHGTLFGNLLIAWTNQGDLAILDLVHLGHAQVLEAAGVFAAELDPHVGLAHDLAFEGGAIGNRNRHLSDLDFDSANLNRLLNQLFGSFQVVRGLDLVKGHGDHVLVAGDAGG